MTESNVSYSAARPWAPVMLVALGAFIVVTSEFLPIGLLTPIAKTLGVSDGRAGLMVTIPGLVAALSAPTMTILAGRLDRRTVMLGLGGLLVASNFAAALAPNFAVMMVARVLFGVSLGGFWTIAVALGGRLVPPGQAARAMTIILAGISTAMVAGVPVGTVIANLAGWRAAFLVAGGVALVVAVGQLMVLPSIAPPRIPGLRQLTELFRLRDARLGLFTVAFVIAGHFAAYTYLRPFMEDSSMSPAHVSMLLLTYGCAGIAGNFIGGAAASRNLRGSLTAIIVILALVILLMPVFGRQQPALTFLLIVWGLAYGGAPITLQLWVFKAAAHAIEGGAAMLVFTYQIFIAFGSVLGGQIVDDLGTSAVMWTGGALVSMALGIVYLSSAQENTCDCFESPKAGELV